MFRHTSKITILDTDKFAILFGIPCSAAAWTSTPKALSWNIFLPSQEADTETKTLKDLKAFLVVTTRNWKSLTSMSSWNFSLTADSLLCPSSLIFSCGKTVQPGLFITNFPFQSYDAQFKYSSKEDSMKLLLHN